jgi:hypothetical protein
MSGYYFLDGTFVVVAVTIDWLLIHTRLFHLIYTRVLIQWNIRSMCLLFLVSKKLLCIYMLIFGASSVGSSSTPSMWVKVMHMWFGTWLHPGRADHAGVIVLCISAANDNWFRLVSGVVRDSSSSAYWCIMTGIPDILKMNIYLGGAGLFSSWIWYTGEYVISE